MNDQENNGVTTAKYRTSCTQEWNGMLSMQNIKKWVMMFDVLTPYFNKNMTRYFFSLMTSGTQLSLGWTLPETTVDSTRVLCYCSIIVPRLCWIELVNNSEEARWASPTLQTKFHATFNLELCGDDRERQVCHSRELRMLYVWGKWNKPMSREVLCWTASYPIRSCQGFHRETQPRYEFGVARWACSMYPKSSDTSEPSRKGSRHSMHATLQEISWLCDRHTRRQLHLLVECIPKDYRSVCNYESVHNYYGLDHWLKKHCQLQFGAAYVQTHETNNNTGHAQTFGALALRPTGNAQGGLLFYSLKTGWTLNRNCCMIEW